MKRHLISALIAVAACFSTAASAQPWPSKPVKIVVGFPAGASTDIIARIYAERLQEHFKKPFIVENAPGAASNRAAGMVAAADADGYTLFMGTVANSISQSVYKNLGFSFDKDFLPVAMVGSAPTVLVVNNELGIDTVTGLIKLAKSKPNQLLYASAGIGTAPHLSAELFKQLAAVEMTHVPYKANNEAVADLLGGRISMIFSPVPTIAGLIKDGRVTALAITSAKRSNLAPNLPTLTEVGVPGFDTAIWYGLLAPKGTPSGIVKAIADVVNKATETPEMKAKLATNGADPLTSTPAEFAKFVRDDVAKWKKVVDTAGITVN